MMRPNDEELAGPNEEDGYVPGEEEAPEEEPLPDDYLSPENSIYPEEQPSDSPLGLAAIHRAAIESFVNPLDSFQEVTVPNDDGHDPYAGPVSEATPEDSEDFWGTMSTGPDDSTIQALQERAKKKALASEQFQNLNKQRK